MTGIYPVRAKILKGGALLVALALAGCAAPAATLLSPAVSGAPAVAEFLGGDHSESFWAARQFDVAAAARRSGRAFDLALTRDETDEARVLLVFADRTDEMVRLRIEERTDALTFVRFTGAPGLARLMSRQMAANLRRTKGFIVEWDDETAAVAR